MAEDVTPLVTPVWCGSNVVAMTGARTGLRWIDLSTRKATVINRTGVPIACSPDGRWLVYKEPKSSRLDNEPGSPEWDPAIGGIGVYDFWRYSLENGRRERFAVAAGGGQWSPDETQFLFYGGKPRTTVTSKSPAWNLVYSRRQWPSGAGLEAAWLSDSRHVLVLAAHQFYVESVYSGDPIRRLYSTIEPGMGLRVDRLNRIYFLSSVKGPADRRELQRCRVEGETIVCEALVGTAQSITAFDLTSNGEVVVFHERGTDCLWLLKSSANGARCAVTGTELSAFSISPDGGRLAFARERRAEGNVLTPRSASVARRSDLLIVDVPNK